MSKWLQFLKSRFLLILFTLLCLLIVGISLATGMIWPNYLFVSHYSVRGIDVSSYQKNIDWKSVAQTNEYTFAFIKATEGESYKDAYFQANWRGTKEQGLLHSAYHFYTASLPGLEQANYFISVVPKEAGMLPPALDLEVFGADRTMMLHEIKAFLDQLEQHYGMKPIIYADLARYEEYIKGNFEDYPIWIRNILVPPQWGNVQKWSFWQYCDRGHVAGIPEWVDLNAFYGEKDQLKALTKPSLA